MPFVGAAIAGSVLGLAGTAASIAAGVINTGIAIGISYVAKALAPKQVSNPEDKRVTPVKGVIRTGGVNPRSFIVGRTMTAGTLVYANTWGENEKTPNQYLVQVIALSDLPVQSQGLKEFWVDGRKTTGFDPTDPELTNPGKGEPISDYFRDSRDNLWIRFHRGTQSAVDSYLDDHFGSDPERPWASTAVGHGVAYVVVTARVDDKLFSGFPSFKFVLDGISLYDIRQDSTVGGSGSQTWGNPSSWTHTTNPAVIAYNILRGISYASVWVYGGQTISAAQLPFASWAAAANACDALVTNADASTEKSFEAGGEILCSTEPFEEIEALLKACNARLAEVGGIYRIHVAAAGSAVLEFDDSSIIITDEQTYTPFPSLENTVNGITGTFVAPKSGWQEKEAPPIINATYVAEDGGRRNLAEIRYERVNGKRQVQRLMKAALQEARRARKHIIVLPPDAFPLEPLDFVSWTSARNGYIDKLFRVDQIDDGANLNVTLYLTEVDPTDYDWTAATDEFPIADGILGHFDPPPQAIVDWAASGQLSIGDDGRTIAVIRVEWDPTDVDDVDRVLLRVRRAGDTALVFSGFTRDVAEGVCDIGTNIVGATDYEVQGEFESDSDRDFTPSAWLAVTTPETTTVAAQLEAQILYDLSLLETDAAGSLAKEIADAKELIERVASDSSMSHAVVFAQTGNLRAAVTHEQSARIDGDVAMAEEITSVQASADSALAAVATEASARASADSTLASQITVVQANVDDVAADVVSEATARANADSALASDITAVEATANAGTASGLIKFEAISAPAGVSARFSLFLRTSIAGSYSQSGFYVDLQGGVGKAIFDVDQFAVVNSSADAATASNVPFFISGGVTYIKSATIQDASIGGVKITDGSVGGVKITDGTITGAKIAGATITGSKIANSTITGALIVDAAITTAKIGDAQITAAKIGTAAITNAKIGNLEVDSAKIADLTVGTSKIADNAVSLHPFAFSSGAFTSADDAACQHTGQVFVQNAHDATIQSLSVTYDGNQPLIIETGYQVSLGSNGGNNHGARHEVWLEVSRNGGTYTVIGQVEQTIALNGTSGGGGDGAPDVAAGLVQDTVSSKCTTFQYKGAAATLTLRLRAYMWADPASGNEGWDYTFRRRLIEGRQLYK